MFLMNIFVLMFQNELISTDIVLKTDCNTVENVVEAAPISTDITLEADLDTVENSSDLSNAVIKDLYLKQQSEID